MEKILTTSRIGPHHDYVHRIIILILKETTSVKLMSRRPIILFYGSYQYISLPKFLTFFIEMNFMLCIVCGISYSCFLLL
jgi:hypothetical protein